MHHVAEKSTRTPLCSARARAKAAASSLVHARFCSTTAGAGDDGGGFGSEPQTMIAKENAITADTRRVIGQLPPHGIAAALMARVSPRREAAALVRATIGGSIDTRHIIFAHGIGLRAEPTIAGIRAD